MSKRTHQPIRICGVGAGYFAQFHWQAWTRMAEVEVLGICDSDEAKAKAAADKYLGGSSCWVGTNAEAMLMAVKPDMLDIVTPPHTHHSLVQLGISAGVSTIVCQKPLAPTMREARAIVELAEAAGVLLVAHENFRWQPWFIELARLLQEEHVVGTPVNLSFRLRPGDGQGNPPAYVSRQPYFKDMERFIIHETGIHFVDVFRSLFGEVRSVLAELHRLNPVIAGEDAGTVVFSFDQGRRGTLDANRLVDHDADDTRLTMGDMLIEGTDGVLRLDGRGHLFHRGEQPELAPPHAARSPWKPPSSMPHPAPCDRAKAEAPLSMFT